MPAVCPQNYFNNYFNNYFSQYCKTEMPSRLIEGKGYEIRQSSLFFHCFSRYSAPIHWLAHSHMTSNNETVSRQMPLAGNIAKTMTSNGKQFTVIREMLTAVARDQRWPDVVAEISPRFSHFAFVLFCYITNHLKNDWSRWEQWILFPENLNVSLDFVSGNFEILGKQNSLFASGPVIKC